MSTVMENSHRPLKWPDNSALPASNFAAARQCISHRLLKEFACQGHHNRYVGAKYTTQYSPVLALLLLFHVRVNICNNQAAWHDMQQSLGEGAEEPKLMIGMRDT